MPPENINKKLTELNKMTQNTKGQAQQRTTFYEKVLNKNPAIKNYTESM